MRSAVCKHLTPGTAIAVIALVFALTGGAIAASSHGGSGSKATTLAARASAPDSATESKAKPKAKRGPRGPAGPRGATGATGASGAQGPTGAQGPQGPAGATGATGERGEIGAPGKEGAQGEEGLPGKQGSPWTAGGTLPPGKTETGVWSYGTSPAGSYQKMALSFPIPLQAVANESGQNQVIGAAHVHFINAAGKEIFEEQEQPVSPECAGGSNEKPAAAAGNLCVYELQTSGTIDLGELRIVDPSWGRVVGAGPAGAVLELETEADGTTGGMGTWAVTAPEAN